MEAILKGLNAAQRAAVSSSSSILQVLAPPGSGKTKTLTSRVAFLLAHNGYAPWNVICCTFTIKASREMRERLRGLVGCEQVSKLILGTFHSICRRYLVTYGHLIGIPKNFGIADSADSLNIIKRATKRLNLSIDPRTARSKISSHKAKGKRLQDLPSTAQRNVEKQEFITIFQEYENALTTSNLLDYDDLLLRCVDLLQTHPTCVANVEALLIDEFQDTNTVQFQLMKLFAQAKRRITIVGDPDQSIYGFRSAEVENLRRMKEYYPETVVINLEENYRSSSAVLKLAQDVIDQDTDRPDKKLKATHCYGTLPVLRRLPNPHEEALWIVAEVRRMMATTGGLLQYSDIAILIRSAYLSLLIEKAVASSGIPYKVVGGKRFFDRVEIRIVVDYLRTISHPDNNSAILEIVNTPSRKIGETTLTELLKIGKTKKVSLWGVMQQALAGDLGLEKKLSKPAEKGLQEVVTIVKDAREAMDTLSPEETPSKLIELVVSRIKLQDHLKLKYKDDHEERWENVQELLTQATDVSLLAAADKPLPDVNVVQQEQLQGSHEMLARFLANISLSTEVQDEEGLEKPRVTISTIHSAKGLEWPVVFVPAVYEGSIPHSRAEDTNEERRLLYVAMTRAQALLYLTFPVVQARDQGESILTQFLPSKVHPRLVATGPEFNDKIIENISSILRRPMSAQEDIASGVLSLHTDESVRDDLWPADGGHRQSPGHFDDDELPCVLGSEHGRPRTINTMPGYQQRASYTTFTRTNSALSVGTGINVTTTMSDLSAFSASNTSLSGFTTASYQMKANPARAEAQAVPILAHPSTEFSSMPKKASLAKSNSNQGNISTFFSQGSFKAKIEPDTLPEAAPILTKRTLTQNTPILSLLPDQQKPAGIPTELSSHKLGAGSLPVKRPRVAPEPASPSRKQYPFFSSSPTREDKATDAPTLDTDTLSEATKRSLAAPLKRLNTGSIYRPSFTRPAPTMHTTTMEMLQGQQGGMGRKTLGVRRTHNGWADRKNK